MSDVVTLSTTDAPPARPPGRGLRTLAVVVAVIAIVAGLLLAADLRGRAIRDDTTRASHDALVAASSAWPGMWDQLDVAPKERNLDAITGTASVGVPTPGGTFVSTELVVNAPDTISVIITVQSDGLVTYVAQTARRNPLDGSASADSSGCAEGEMREGIACRDWVQRFATRWQD